MNKDIILKLLRSIFLGKRFSELKNIEDQARYMTINFMFIVVMATLLILGISLINVDMVRTVIDFILVFFCLVTLILVRSKIPLKLVSIFPVTLIGIYCVYLIYTGTHTLWVSIWFHAFPLLVFFLCSMTIGLIESIIGLVLAVLILFVPLMPHPPVMDIRLRFIMGYILILAMTIIYERISVYKTRKEEELKAELANKMDIMQIMKDNIHYGIFLMDKELNILPEYSRPLTSIFSYHDSDLTGSNFLDIISSSFNTKQLQSIKGYFSMIFSKTKGRSVLESANPISEFEYKTDNQTKILNSRFYLVEQSNAEPVIIGIIEDITKEKEFEHELQAQKEAQELEMKNIFDVLQIDPVVFQDFIDETEINFNYINSLLKDNSLTEKQVVIKLYQVIHSIKANALILGLEFLGQKTHELEDKIKTFSGMETVSKNDILSLTIEIKFLMSYVDSYAAITNKINTYKTSNQVDTILYNSLSRAAGKISGELKKNVKLKSEQIDFSILDSKLRKPIKEILYQLMRNSIYHGIELPEARVKKNKNPEGLLKYSIIKNKENALVIYSDDGGGLNWEKIKTKYIEKYPEKPDIVNKKILFASIFSPEFSTSDEVNFFAGRGVGLSLVKDIVKENFGTINVVSSDSGLKFMFTFPLSA